MFGAEPLPSGFEYTQIYGEKRSADTSRFDSSFPETKYVHLILAGEAAPTFSIDWADRVYIHKAGGGLVILKTDIGLSAGVKAGRIYSADSDFLVHVKSKTKNRYDALFFTGKFTEDNIEAFLQNRDFEPKADDKVSWFWNLIPLAVAHADSSSNCDTGLGHLGVDGGSLVGTGAMGQVTECLRGMVSGAWNATGGSILAVARGVAKAVTRPVESFRSVKAGVLGIGHFVNNIASEFSRLGNEFMQLPAQIQSRIICELASSMGTSAVISVATGGAALGLIWRSMTQVLQRVMRQFSGNRKLAAFARKVRSSLSRRTPPEAVAYSLSAQKAYEAALSQVDDLYAEFVVLEKNRGAWSRNFEGQAAVAGASLSLYERRSREWRQKFAEVREKVSGLNRALDTAAVTTVQTCVKLSSLQRAARDKLRVLERRSGAFRSRAGSSSSSQR